MSDSSQQSSADILTIPIEQEMRSSYLDYAMSVIVSRALPDVRDGLKPVHRRILYAMNEAHCDWNKPYRKSARIVGEVMGKFHPHGDSAIYDALVRMAQPFSLRLPLIDGQGNFGSMDGDPPAAMRYTESRLEKVAHTLLEDIDKETVDFQENYDGSEQEPTVLPSRFPNLLVNGSGGIAVGMATNIPPHNLGEVIDATCLVLDNEEIEISELMEVIPGPDFPTGGTILGRSGSHSALQTGRGSVVMRGKTEIETTKTGKEAIIITEIPYQVNKARMVERIAELVRDKKIEGISDIRDESDKSGVRVVVETKRDAMPEVVLNQLFKFTPLQTSFGANMLALDLGRPKLMNLKDILLAFIHFREEVITRRTNFLLGKARSKAHTLIGLAIAVANIDEVIRMIRQAPDPATAREQLMARSWPAENIAPLLALVDDSRNVLVDGECHFTEEQARAILEMRLSKLTALESDKIDEELRSLAEDIKRYLEILGSKAILRQILREELLEVKEEFATPRRSDFEENEYEHDIEDLIQREDMAVTLTMGGYIKRVPLSTYRAQRRGGKGRSGLSMHDEDVTTEIFIANTHTPVLFFSNYGIVYKLKVYKLPLGTPQARGRALVNIFPLAEGEVINNVLPLPEEKDIEGASIMFATAKGNIRRNAIEDFQRVQANGKIAIRLDDDDKLIGVKICREDQHLLLASAQGKSLRCPVEAVRVFKSRTSDGVRGMKLAQDDRVISMSIVSGADSDVAVRDDYLHIPAAIRAQLNTVLIADEDPSDLIEEAKQSCSLSGETILEWAKTEQFILTVTENGYGKRTSSHEYRITNRGGQGVVNIVTSERNGNVVASFSVTEQDHIMLITDQGKLIRCPVHDIRIAGRNTQGVTIFKTADGEKVVSTARIAEANGNNDDEGDEAENNDTAEASSDTSSDTTEE